MNSFKEQPHPHSFRNSLKPGAARRYTAGKAMTLLAVIVALILGGMGLQRAFLKSPRSNVIYLENQKHGTTRWQSPALKLQQRVSGSSDDVATSGAKASANTSSGWTDTTLRGYASATSINHGDAINIYVGTTLPGYTLQIYRMGWYAGTGARLIQTVSNLPGQNQPIPAADPTTGLLQLNWAVSYRLQTDTSWVTGAYLAELVGSDGTVAYIPFVVRDDSSTAPILYQIPINTWQAYNNWGGKSLYDYNSAGGRAYKVSLDRPYAQASGAGGFFDGDYNMIRFLESQGYNMSYATSVDTQSNPSLLNNHKIFLSNYHDEYWSKSMRDNITAARNQGKHLAFFDADSIYWQIRFEASSSGVANRVITCYKDATLDPMSQTTPSLTTVRWRDNPVNQPENALLGAMYLSSIDYGSTVPWVVSNASNWVYNGTGLNNGSSIAGLVGYEFDSIWNNGQTPAGLVALSNSPVVDQYGYSDIANGTIYTYAPSNALVFDAGTVDWSWKVDDNADQSHGADPRVQLMTENILNAMINGVPSSSTPTPTPTPSPTPSPSPTTTPTPGTPYQNTVLSDSPFAYWRLGEAPGSTRAIDSSGNGYTATYSGGITLGVPGAINNDANTAISSDGTGKITPPAFSSVTDFTIEGWTYLSDPNWDSAGHYNNALYGQSGDVRLLIRPGSANTSSYALGYFGVWLNGTEYALQPVNNNLSNTGQWVYWALVRSGGTLTVYRNGVQVAQRTDLPASAPANISGLMLALGSSYFLKGQVDEVALYNHALSASRIQIHYNTAIS